MVPTYRPVKVMASASKGIATDLGCIEETEDTITLLVDWEKRGESSRRATGVYTASWTAPQKAGVHSNQYFHFMGSKGEVRVNQAKRGYELADDEAGLSFTNPFYMYYHGDENGDFGGQHGYGYISFEKFVDACQALKDGKTTLDELDRRGLPTLKNTIATGAILEAGRISLDEKRPVEIAEKDGVWSLKYT
jgi:D-galacturonate reductase